MKASTLRFLAGFALTLLGFLQASAQPVVLEIDWSNPSAVTFTATGNVSATAYDGSVELSQLKFNDGIALLNFFPSNVTTQDIGSLVSSSLYDSSHTSAFFDILSSWNDAVPNSSPGLDLTLWSDPGATTLDFRTGSAAFNGVATFNLSGYSSFTDLFPALNTTGTVVVWNGNATIGSWKITGAPSAIPEPSTYAVLAGITALAGVVVRRRQRSA